MDEIIVPAHFLQLRERAEERALAEEPARAGPFVRGTLQHVAITSNDGAANLLEQKRGAVDEQVGDLPEQDKPAAEVGQRGGEIETLPGRKRCI